MEYKTKFPTWIIALSELLITGLLIILGLSIFAPGVFGATWVNNPNSCPNNYQSQTCSGSNLVCGYNGGVTFCYDMTTINPPSGSATSNTDQDSGSFNGGYIMDCVSYDGTSPFCDNGGSEFCDRNSSCYNNPVQRDTTCKPNLWASSNCSSCRSGFLNCTSYNCAIQVGVTTNNSQSHYNTCTTFACNSGYLDCDGAGDGNNPTGCEILNGGSCTIGGLVGVYSGCNGAVGNCVVNPSNFVTGTQANYSTSLIQNFLWGWDYGLGNLFFLRNNATNSNFSINKFGCIVFNDSTTQCTASTGSSSGGGGGGISTITSTDKYAIIQNATTTNVSINETQLNNTIKSIYNSTNPNLFINIQNVTLYIGNGSNMNMTNTTTKNINVSGYARLNFTCYWEDATGCISYIHSNGTDLIMK